MDMPATPPGFVEIPTQLFVNANGPLHGRMADGKFTLGFRVEERHCNARLVCHGGMLMTLADMLMPLAANLQEDLHRFLPTISLQADFLAPAERGAWLEGRCEVLRMTRNLVFAQGLLTARETPILRASSVMKLPPERDPAFAPIRKLFL